MCPACRPCNNNSTCRVCREWSSREWDLIKGWFDGRGKSIPKKRAAKSTDNSSHGSQKPKNKGKSIAGSSKGSKSSKGNGNNKEGGSSNLSRGSPQIQHRAMEGNNKEGGSSNLSRRSPQIQPRTMEGIDKEGGSSNLSRGSPQIQPRTMEGNNTEGGSMNLSRGSPQTDHRTMDGNTDKEGGSMNLSRRSPQSDQRAMERNDNTEEGSTDSSRRTPQGVPRATEGNYNAAPEIPGQPAPDSNSSSVSESDPDGSMDFTTQAPGLPANRPVRSVVASVPAYSVPQEFLHGSSSPNPAQPAVAQDLSFSSEVRTTLPRDFEGFPERSRPKHRSKSKSKSKKRKHRRRSSSSSSSSSGGHRHRRRRRQDANTPTEALSQLVALLSQSVDRISGPSSTAVNRPDAQPTSSSATASLPGPAQPEGHDLTTSNHNDRLTRIVPTGVQSSRRQSLTLSQPRWRIRPRIPLSRIYQFPKTIC